MLDPVTRAPGETMPTTINMSHEELEDRRRAILEGIGLTEKELQQRAKTYMLQPNERKAFEALRAIDFLLGTK